MEAKECRFEAATPYKSLIALDARCLDDGVPSLDLGSEITLQRIGRNESRSHRLGAETGEALDHFWIFDGSLKCSHELVGNILRQPLGRPHRVPCGNLETRDRATVQRRQVRE